MDTKREELIGKIAKAGAGKTPSVGVRMAAKICGYPLPEIVSEEDIRCVLTMHEEWLAHAKKSAKPTTSGKAWSDEEPDGSGGTLTGQNLSA